MTLPLYSFVQRSADSLYQAVKRHIRQWAKPDNHTLAPKTVADLIRPKSELV